MTLLFCSFEYLPILPRMRAFVSNENSVSDLYEYQNSSILNRELEGDDESGRPYRDFFDGSLYKDLVKQYGSKEAVTWDIFLGFSWDGFQTFGNKSYDCWPLIAINLNLALSQRFLMRNVIPLGFTKGPKEPVRMDTFFIPLIEEISKINSRCGIELKFHDGVTRKVKVHVMWITDLQALAKVAGLAGINGRSPCRSCVISDIRLQVSNHYYLPSKLRIADEGEQNGRIRMLKKYDSGNLTPRNVRRIKATWRSLRDSSVFSKRRRQALSTKSGLKKRTAVFDLDSVIPFASFPVDMMHLLMNLVTGMVELWKGDNHHLRRIRCTKDDFVISTESWARIDVELAARS